jgi:hypothetical protein
MNYTEYWAEILSVFFLIIGFFIGIFIIKSLFMFYVIIFLWGLIFGRLWYRIRKNFTFPWGLIIAGFLLGFILSAYLLDYNISIIILITLFFLGIWVSYNVHSKKYIKSLEY